MTLEWIFFFLTKSSSNVSLSFDSQQKQRVLWMQHSTFIMVLHSRSSTSYKGKEDARSKYFHIDTISISDLIRFEYISVYIFNIISEFENVKSFTRTNINKPDFTPRKARKSRHFWHFKPTKHNLWGFLWWINVDKLSIYGSLSIDIKFLAHIFPTGQFFYTDISVISVTFSNSVHPWKRFTPEKYSPLKNIHPWHIFTH